MQEMIEKVYYFSKNEFLVLLGLGRMEEIYSFELPGKAEFENEDFILALYQLMKKDCVRIESGPVLTEKAERILQWICAAERALVVVPAEEGEQRICYLSEAGIVVTELARQNDEIRLRMFPEEAFREILFAGTGVAEQPIITEAAGQQMEAFHGKMREQRRQILVEEMDFFAADLYAWSDRAEVQSTWEILDLRRKVSLKQLVFRKGCVNPWVLERSEEGLQLCYDSLEFRKSLQCELLGAEGKEEQE